MDIMGLDGDWDEIEPLKPVMEHWIQLIATYSNRHSHPEVEDTAYWYGEWTDVAVLGAAAWMAGCTALSEYPTVKGRGKNRKNGRPDLYIECGRGSYFVVEAKIHCTAIRSENPTPLNRKVIEANNEAKANYEGTRVGVVFVKPNVPEIEDFKKNSSIMINEFISKIRFRKMIFDGMAWSFPKSSRFHTGDDDTYYPGILVLLRKFRSTMSSY